ncbi:formyltetrahydrofolate deformylase [Pseudomaricurvus alkylphenolicus]|jgi:formyltetrahydrofolate deformylase|uniref:formyltetrahydrofolate deformylase n=1 Tax=Pseudomaricurvus alkylphenolicus TaxID=1306991 RepID=UPI0014229A02|nr:formyltetrahydrofolate deformylase [Pseudomaricurvus alkylphenolicus]NIB40647.1 formyltetrahydrofolate deformylase [Pseudomaricurvus alkylphenolicus]
MTQQTACKQYILTYKCPDRLGIFAEVSQLFYRCGAFVTDTSHYTDPDNHTCFYRKVFDDRSLTEDIDRFQQQFAQLADRYNMEYSMTPMDYRPRLLLAVSKYDHCLNVLLTKWKSGVLPVDIVGVVSNHDDCRGLVEWYGIPYHHFPISKETKPQQEAQILGLMDKERVDLLVLARYMQVLSDHMCQQLEGRAINIHHSFLPSFKGAKPYHQAHARGVKLIGATAHYVTSDLDEGPIIAQDVRPVTHAQTAADMVVLGHDTEATTLARAVKLHVERRVVLNGARTVIL